MSTYEEIVRREQQRRTQEERQRRLEREGHPEEDEQEPRKASERAQGLVERTTSCACRGRP
jgi:hypothetical protein